uniref:NADH-ubiquinone oxidoreductase chain 5 n=1 Tax=Teliapsocus conterminus TaxID=1407779 RepID=A0A8K2AU17_9NEOP|nr:NADH dehydrogenase subunit 5 [Teliapsocus conterminus]
MYFKSNCNLVISIILLLLSMFTMFLYLYISLYNKIYFIDWEILLLNSCSLGMNILIDYMSSLFMSIVMMISLVVILYSKSYMKGDTNMGIFILLVFCFVISMILLIISPNMISILLGWDGLGLISYCLVIYYQNVKSYNAGMITAMTNRIGDVLILMSIAWMLNLGSWNFYIYMFYEKDLYLIIGLLIMVASMTKSAQIPFSSWLPAAMAAPTPVSALVHSSTLVTAGVYLLIRFSHIFNNYYLCITMLMLSVFTMFMSGLGAIFETDLKKIIALSTLSQLGLMISSLCLGFTEFAFFHLLTHALFKSLLFMCAGYIIHGMNDCQDIRYMGAVINQSPLLSIYFCVSNLSLCGMPFLAGFYSKDITLELLLMSMSNLFIVILYFVATFFTVVYTFRLIYFSMINNFKLSCYHSFSDNDFGMLSWMFIIQMMVVLGGSTMSWTLFMDFTGISLSFSLKIFTLTLCVLGGVVGVHLAKFSVYKIQGKFKSVYYNLMGEMWFMPYISTYSINYLILNTGYIYFKVIDSGWGEFIGGQGTFNTIMNINSINYFNDSKNIMITIYLMLIMVFMFMLIFC